MTEDLNVLLPSGRLNIRAGAIIVKEGKALFIFNEHYYTVGGRIRFGEDAYEALLREMREELGEYAALLHEGTLVAIEENFYPADGVRVHEYGFYFRFDGSRLPAAEGIRLKDCEGHLEFLSPEEIRSAERLYPQFLKQGIPTELCHYVKREGGV